MSVAGLGLLVAAFALGSLPFGLWIGRLAGGVDVRRQGSGNLGATNVLRVVGPVWGALTLVLDAGKGALAVGGLPRIFGLAGHGEPGLWALGAGLAAALGHCFSPWVGGRGGKGVATALGVYLATAPAAGLLAVAAFGVALAVGRIVSLASAVMAAAFPLGLLLLGGEVSAQGPGLQLGIALCVLIAWTHRSNWRRIAGGREPRIGGRR